MNYNISDFTEENYRKLLKIAKKKYKFYSYKDIGKFESGIIWRHDIDYSVHRANSLVQIEEEVEVFSTWFVHLHSPFYNVWEKEETILLKNILKRGGKIGLHFEPEYYDLKNYELERMEDLVEKERIFLENIIEESIDSFSFHNPDINGGFMDIDQYIIAGLINVYHHSIRELFTYCSDSNGYWRFKRLEDVLINGSSDDKLHILTHPAWWQEETMAPRERIKRCVEGRSQKVMKDYDDFLLKNQRENIR